MTSTSLDFLLTSFRLLRRQIGDERCLQIVNLCVEQSKFFDVRNQVKILTLLELVVDEPTRSFDRLIPSIISLLTSQNFAIDFVLLPSPEQDPISKD